MSGFSSLRLCVFASCSERSCQRAHSITRRGGRATRGPKPGARVPDMSVERGAPLFCWQGAALTHDHVRKNTRIGCFSFVIMKCCRRSCGRRGCGKCGRRDGTGTLPVTACLVGGRAEARYDAGRLCGRSSMVEPQPSKLVMRVRFPSPAPALKVTSIGSKTSAASLRPPQPTTDHQHDYAGGQFPDAARGQNSSAVDSRLGRAAAFPGPFAQACEHRVGLVDLVADGAEIGADRAEIGARATRHTC